MPYKAFLLGRSGDDLRWPYCCGNAADEDNLDLCDVRRMRDALKARGYQSIAVVGAEAKEGEIIDRLNEAIRSCASSDTFVFYFSGHTRLRHGTMQLVLTKPQDGDETLSASTLIEKLQGCKASAKLIVLDCCYAGEVVVGWQPGIYENLRILAATDRATPAGEFDELEGGIFTYFLCEALTKAELWRAGGGLIDADGIIWSDRLSAWLKERVGDYAKAKGRRVGEPLEYPGSDQQRVPIARVAWQDRPGPLFSPNQLQELFGLLGTADLSTGSPNACLDDLLDRIQPAYESPRPERGAALKELIAYLADMGVRQANVPVALLEYVHRLADVVTTHAQPLRAWVDRVAEALERNGDLSLRQRATLGSSQRQPVRLRPLNLMVVPGQPDKAKTNTFANGGAWLDTGEDKAACVAARDSEITVGDIPRLIKEALEDQRVISRLQQGKSHAHLNLEIFLPRGLLAVDPDRWTPWPADPDVPTPPLSYHYNLIVRPWERIAPMEERRWTAGWESSWGQCLDCRGRSANDAVCVAWLDAPEEHYGTRLNRGECLFILKAPPQRADLVRALTQGVAKLLWSDESFATDLEARLAEGMANGRLNKLPDIVRMVRVDTWKASNEQHTGRLHLLWDDPGHKPPIWLDPGSKPAGAEPPPPLVNAFDRFST